MTGTFLDNDTIAAIATPSGLGGIGIVKISGPSARKIRDRLFRPSGTEKPTVSHHLVHGVIINCDDGSVVDEVLVSWMAGPHSYTGEDVVEINSHGGPVVIRRILGLVLDSGARMAAPGEFTRRGFLNGRMDLTQAEAVVDLINAKTERAARMANRQLGGEFKTRVEGILSVLKDAYAWVAASIDFPEDVGDDGSHTAIIASRLEQDVLKPLRAFIEHHHVGQVLREGARIAVVGRPNVGKSSLMNRLLDRERVIVSDVPGTTRDAITDATSIEGIPVVLVDTAGLRKTPDPIEAIGIQKTQEAISTAQLVLFLVEAGSALHPDDIDNLLTLNDLPLILVRNKMDLTEAHDIPCMMPDREEVPVVVISAKYGDGIGALKRVIVDVLTWGQGDDEDNDVMPNQRQVRHLMEAASAVDRAIDILGRQGEDELVAMEMDSAVAHINMILGTTASEDILDTVFSRFCIGK
ncbi:MAG: tRNA uridine-5-carboxymethylaminomethyl(34) synthesis GTPase MnmE [Pseudomonadota bacterium]